MIKNVTGDKKKAQNSEHWKKFLRDVLLPRYRTSICIQLHTYPIISSAQTVERERERERHRESRAIEDGLAIAGSD